MRTATTAISILHHEHPRERQFRYACGILAVVLVAGYVFLVSASVINIIARKDAHAAMGQTTSAIAELEEQYFARIESIDEERASDLGLVPVAETHFVERTVRLGRAPDAQ